MKNEKVNGNNLPFSSTFQILYIDILITLDSKEAITQQVFSFNNALQVSNFIGDTLLSLLLFSNKKLD